MNPSQVADQMAVTMARQLGQFEILQLGLASALGQVAACLAKRLYPHLLLEDPAALTINPTARKANLTQSEAVALEGATQQLDASRWIGEIMPTLAGKAGQFMRPLEIDVSGKINTLKVQKPSGDWMRIAGLAGLAELAELANPFLIYLPSLDKRSFVEEVQFAVSDPLRHSHAGDKARMLIVSNLAVIEIDRQGARVVSIHPGVNSEELKQALPASVLCQTDKITEPPSDEELKLLNEVDPEKIRELEFLGGKARFDRLRELAAVEAAG